MKERKHPPEGKKAWGIYKWSVVVLAALVGFWLYTVVSEVGLFGLISGLMPRNAKESPLSTVQLIEQPIYQVKKKQEVLGVSVLRIISKQQPEEFLVLEGVSRPLVDKVYGKKPDLTWTNLMANQLLKLRQSGENSSPITVEVQDVKTLKSGMIQQKKKNLPYWQLEVKFKLSNEDAPRSYQAAVIRNLGPQSAKDDKDTLVVGYAQKEAFQKELLSDLMNHLRFEQN